MDLYTCIKNKIIITLCLMGFVSHSQNLVLNPSFESLNAGALQCSWYTTQAGFNSAINNWTCPTGGSSDIFSNSLATTCFCSPNSTNSSRVGTQNPRTANAMVGGAMWGNGGCSPYREYIQGQLSSSLIAGTSYKIEFYVSLADESKNGCNNIGLKFSTTPVNVSSMCVYAATPDVNYTGTPITDKINWTKLEFCFTPTVTGLQYFMIGNFFNNVATSTISVVGTNSGNAYYYFDDVSISPSSSVTVIPSASFINNCSTTTTTLTALPAAVNYTWTAPSGASIISGTNSQTAQVTGNGTYTLAVQNPSACISSPVTTTLAVTSTTNPLILSPISGATTVCNNQTNVTYSVSNLASTNYTWSVPAGATIVSTPTNSNVITVNFGSSAGVISLQASNSCTTASVNMNVSLNPNLNLSITPNSSTICAGSSNTLTASGATSYTWSPSSTLSSANSASVSANPLATTIYTVLGSVGTCTGVTTATVNVNPNLTLNVSPNSSTICSGSSSTLTASGATSYTWLPSSTLSSVSGTSVSANPLATTIYTVIGAAGTCTRLTTATINVNPNLTLNVTPNSSTICSGSSSTLTASGATSYTWSPSSTLSSASGTSVSANPLATTIYTVIGAAGTCTGVTTATINVNPNLTLNVTPNSSTICVGSSSTLTASGATSYTWSPSSTLSSVSGTSVTANPLATTIYTVLGSAGTCTGVTTATVNTTTLSISVSSNATVCPSSQHTLSASGATNYTWSPIQFLNTNSGANVISTPSTSIIYTITGSNGFCIGTNTVSVVVSNSLVINATVSSPTICPFGNTNITASGATSYTWSPANSLNSGFGSSVVANPINTTTYTIIGAIGTCTNSTQIVVTVTTTPVLTVTPTQTICPNDKAILFVSGGNLYNWNPSAGLNTTTGNNIIASPLITTIYTVSSNNIGACASTATVQIIVLPKPTVYAGKDSTINIDEEIVLSGTSNLPVGNYGFLSPDGMPLICNLCPKVTVHPLENTCYVLQAIDPTTGCKNFDTVCVFITKDWNIYIPNTFSPNGDLENEYFIPKGFGLAKINLTIFDRWGAQIFKEEGTTLGWDGKYKGKLCQEGVYIYQVEATSLGGNEYSKTGHVTLLSKLK